MAVLQYAHCSCLSGCRYTITIVDGEPTPSQAQQPCGVLLVPAGGYWDVFTCMYVCMHACMRVCTRMYVRVGDLGGCMEPAVILVACGAASHSGGLITCRVDGAQVENTNSSSECQRDSGNSLLIRASSASSSWRRTLVTCFPRFPRRCSR